MYYYGWICLHGRHRDNWAAESAAKDMPEQIATERRGVEENDERGIGRPKCYAARIIIIHGHFRYCHLHDHAIPTYFLCIYPWRENLVQGDGRASRECELWLCRAVRIECCAGVLHNSLLASRCKVDHRAIPDGGILGMASRSLQRRPRLYGYSDSGQFHCLVMLISHIRSKWSISKLAKLTQTHWYNRFL